MSFEEERTSRAYGQRDSEWPSEYDEKDDMDTLRARLAARKKPLLIGIGLLCLVIVGVTIAVATGGSTDANTQSGNRSPAQQQQQEQQAPTTAASSAAGSVASEAQTPAGSADGPGRVVAASFSTSSSGSAGAGDTNHAGTTAANTTTAGSAATTPSHLLRSTGSPAQSASPAQSTPAQTPASNNGGPQLTYKAVDFDWTNTGNWQYASGAGIPGGMFTEGGIKLTPANSPTPIRTKQGWSGEKVVLIEWENSPASDTNIWMLNTKLENQFGVGNGWPNYGELDIFEMFTQDAITQRSYDFSGFGGRSVGNYGQLTMHMGARAETNLPPCFCPAAYSKSVWYQNAAPMTSGCTAQFSNDRKNSIATVWGSDGNGKYIQLLQHPTITKGGKTADGRQTYDIAPGGTTTQKIYNNANTFWGVPASAACAGQGGHNPATGYPFFESFRIVLEEQKKNDGAAWFKVTNIQIFTK